MARRSISFVLAISAFGLLGGSSSPPSCTLQLDKTHPVKVPHPTLHGHNAGEGEGEGEGSIATGEGEGEGVVVGGEGEGEGSIATGEGEGEGEGAVVTGEGEGEGSTSTGEGEGSTSTGEGEGEGSVTTGVWRPFSADSPWNTPIGNNPAIDPNSATMINDFANSSPYGSHLDINIQGFSVPLYWVDTSTPIVQMTADIGGQGWGAEGFSVTYGMPLPSGAQPDPQSDHHILAVDKARMLSWDCWDASVSGSTGHAGLCAATDLNGTGVRPLAAVASPWTDAHGSRACGFPLVAGLIRPEEIAAGHIDHALVVAYPHVQAGKYTPPASTAQANNGTSISTRGIPCGGRIQLDPSIDVAASGASPAGQIVLRALQEYGAYVGDYSGAIDLYADNAPDALAAWNGVLDTYALNGHLDLTKLRVMQLGTVYDNGNGG